MISVSIAVCKLQQMTSNIVPIKLNTFYRILYGATLL